MSRPDAECAPTRVLLVRHGQSTFNVNKRYQGRSDEPVLTESGAEAAALTGRYLARARFDFVASSPLRRACQTAAIIRGELQGAPPLETCLDLRELDLVGWQGMSMEAVENQYPEAYRTWLDLPHDFRMRTADGGEFFPVRDLFEQAHRFWRQFLPRHAGQTIVVVTHGGTARALISTAAGIGIECFQSLQQSNLGISILEFAPGSASARIEALNLTAHLGERAPKLKQGKRGLRALLVAGEQRADSVQSKLSTWRTDFWCSAADAQSKQAAAALPQFGRIITGDALAFWESTVQKRLRDRLQADKLANGVFIAPGEVLSGWLARVFRMEGDGQPWRPFGSAVVHYPEPDRPPVLQSYHPMTCEEAQL